MSGTPVPGYRLIRLLGRGGMGAVYQAVRETDGQTVALKLAQGRLGAQGLDRLRREAELLSRISDPHLPRFVEALEVGEGFVLAMEFMAGDPVSSHQAQLPEDLSERLELAVRVLTGMARGLQALHAAGIVHRDLKPANVILTPTRAVLVDLGLARGPDVVTLTATGHSVGTPEYLPPEQVSGEPVGPAADLYQVGLMARDLLVGSRRRPGVDLVQEALQRAVRRLPLVQEEAPWVPDELAQWIDQACHPSVEARPPAPAHLVKLLELLGSGLRVEAETALPDRPTWMGSSAQVAVARARKRSSAEGWDEAESARREADRAVASWMGTPVGAARAEPQKGGAAAAPVTISAPAPAAGSSRHVWVLLPLAILALMVGFGMGGSEPAQPAEPALVPVLSWPEGGFRGRLIALEGGEGLRLEEPRSLAFERGDDGYWGVPVDNASVTLGLPGGRWKGQLPLPLVPESLSIQWSDDKYWLRHWIPPKWESWFETEAGRVIHHRRGGLFGPIAELGRVLRLRGEIEGGPQWSASVDVANFLADQARHLQVPSLPGPEGNQPATEFPAASEWYQRNHGALAAALSAPDLDESLRQDLYLQTLGYSRHERRFGDSPIHLPLLWHRAIGPWFRSGRRPSLHRSSPGSWSSAHYIVNLRIRSGAWSPQRPDVTGGREEGILSARLDSEGVARISVPPSEPRRPVLAAEVGIYVSDFNKGSELEMLLGGRSLFIPIEVDQGWHYQRVPPRWLEEAWRGETVELGLRPVQGTSAVEVAEGSVRVVRLEARVSIE